MVISNGSRLRDPRMSWFFEPETRPDWVALSIDSSDPLTHETLGRKTRHGALSRQDYLSLAGRFRAAGIHFKVNTVVTSINVDDDLNEWIAELAPERWKVLQVLPVDGQNDGEVGPLCITGSAFEAFVRRHREGLSAHTLIAEANDDVRGSYAMVDPAGRFFDSSVGCHRYSAPILEVGVGPAISMVSFSQAKLEARGGVYDWGDPSLVQLRPRATEPANFVALSGCSGSGKDCAAKHLAKHGYHRLSFADPLKRAVQEAFGFSDEQLWGAERDTVVPELNLSPRRVYQSVSDALREIDPEVWTRAFRRDFEVLSRAGKKVVCTDVRTSRELELVRELGARTLRLTRPQAGAPGAAGAHSTETELGTWGDELFDTCIVNDGSLEALYSKIDAAIA